MIYFDENKKAYNTRPDTCICEIDDVNILSDNIDDIIIKLYKDYNI